MSHKTIVLSIERKKIFLLEKSFIESILDLRGLFSKSPSVNMYFCVFFWFFTLENKLYFVSDECFSTTQYVISFEKYYFKKSSCCLNVLCLYQSWNCSFLLSFFSFLIQSIFYSFPSIHSPGNVNLIIYLLLQLTQCGICVDSISAHRK